MTQLNNMFENLFVILIIMLIILLIIYIVQAIFLNKFNKLKYNKKTIKGWIPIANIYLLGKLTCSKFVGWVLVMFMFLNSTFTTTINGVEKTTRILPEWASTVYNIIITILYIYAIIEYFRLKKLKSNINKIRNMENNNNTINTNNNVINQNINNNINNIKSENINQNQIINNEEYDTPFTNVKLDSTTIVQNQNKINQ